METIEKYEVKGTISSENLFITTRAVVDFELETVIIHSGKVLTTTNYGPYENIKAPYSKLEKYLKEHVQEKEFTIEE